MKKNKNLSAFLLGILMIMPLFTIAQVSVSGVLKADKTYSQMLLLKEKNGQLTTLDSSKISAEGKYSFSINTKESGFYLLKPMPSEPNQLMAYVIVQPKQKITLNLAAENNALNYEKASGSEDMVQIVTVLNKLNTTNKRLAELQGLYPNASEEEKTKIQKEFNELSTSFSTYLKNEFSTKPYILSNVVLLNFLNFDNDFEIYKNVATVLNTKYPKVSEVQQLFAYVNQPQGPKVGKPAPEIALSDPQGTVRKLSSLKGKYVLVDFWASWCGPCRKENPNVVKLYEKYKDKGFDVFSVSLDRDKASWERAIQADNLAWKNHVSDLQQWNSSVIPIYKFNGIPYTVLLNTDGTILAIGLRGEELEEKLHQIFGF